MIKNISLFKSLFGIHVPIPEEQDYYFNLLQNSPQYSWLSTVLDSFFLWEEINDYDHDRLIQDKEKCFQSLLTTLQNSRSFFNLQEIQSFGPYNEKKFSFIQPENYYLSLDLKSANYNLFCSLDPNFAQHYGLTWEDFCQNCQISSVLISSKPFRQYVFGHLNPNKIQKLLLSNLAPLSNCFMNHGFSLSAVTADEIILDLGSKPEPIAQKFCAAQNLVLDYSFSFPYRLTIFRHIKINQFAKDLACREIYQIDDSQNLILQYKKLFGAPGNMFYFLFRKFVLNQEPQDLDLYFKTDGLVAKWVLSQN